MNAATPPRGKRASGNAAAIAAQTAANRQRHRGAVKSLTSVCNGNAHPEKTKAFRKAFRKASQFGVFAESRYFASYRHNGMVYFQT